MHGLELFHEAEMCCAWQICHCFKQQLHLEHFIKGLCLPGLLTKGAAMGGHQLIQFDPSLSSSESALNHLQYK